jgi:WD40 repeat protein
VPADWVKSAAPCLRVQKSDQSIINTVNIFATPCPRKHNAQIPLVAMAETVGSLAAFLVPVEVIISTLEHVKSVVHVSRELGDTFDKILDVCKGVKRNSERKVRFMSKSPTACFMIKENLKVVCNIAEKCAKTMLRDRVRYMPKALSRLGILDKVEQPMQFVQVLTSPTWVSRLQNMYPIESLVDQLEKQKKDLEQVLGRIDEISTRIDNAIFDVENQHGPLSYLALDGKVDDLLRQRFYRPGDSVAHGQGDVTSILHNAPPAVQPILTDNQDTVTRRAVPTKPALQDSWVCNFSSVPALSSYLVETQYVRNLKNVLLDETGQCRTITVHGWGGTGKTAACKMLANDDIVRQRFRDGIVWVELGETASSGALVERLAHAVKLSGGEKTAESIVRRMNANEFDLAKEEFQNWFDNRKVLFVLDNIWESKDRTFNRWVNALRELPGVKRSLLCSSRTLLGETNVEFSQLHAEEQTILFLRHLQLRQDCREYQGNMELTDQILGGCAGLPLALSMAASHLRQDPKAWKTLSSRIRTEIAADESLTFTFGGHTGLSAVFQASFEWLVRERTPPRDCLFSWAELYASLCVTDPPSPGLPVCVLSLMWGMCAESALEVCQTFVSLSLATLSAGEMDSRLVKLQDLPLRYCGEHCARAPFSECTWHWRIIEGLLAKAGVPMVLDDATGGGHKTASGDLQAGAAMADAVVEAFMGLAEDSTLKEYFVKNLVRHICGCEDESLVVLARGVLSDYRWLLAVCSRQSLSFAASQYFAVVSCVRERRANNEGFIGTDEATDFGRGFIRDLENIADILRFCVPPEAIALQDNGEESPCSVHGEWSVGDPGLAHQLVSRLGIVSGENDSQVFGTGGGNGDDAGGSSVGCTLVDMLLSSIKRCVAAPWLVPANRGYLEADRRTLARVIREEWNCFLSFVLGNAECVALGGREEIRVYNLESGDLIRELPYERAKSVRSLAVSSERCGLKPEEMGDVSAVKLVWLVAGCDDGSVHIWDLETDHFVATLHPMNGPQNSYSLAVSVAADCCRVVNFCGYALHVWDLLSDGTLEGYEYVVGCNRRLDFELASAALLYQGRSKRSCVEQCSSGAVRFERIPQSDWCEWSPQSEKKRKLCSSDGNSREERKLGSLMSSDESSVPKAIHPRLCMSVEQGFAGEKVDWHYIPHCRVANCKDRALVVTVNYKCGGVSVQDALTGEVIHKFQVNESVSSVAAFRREDGRFLVATGAFVLREYIRYGDRRTPVGMIRMRLADSGELIGQWQALHQYEKSVPIAVTAGKVMGAYDGSGMWIWSHGGGGPVADQSNKWAISDALPPPRATLKALNNISIHSSCVSSIAFSGDGKVAASCAYNDSFVLVWDTATGNILRELHIDEPVATHPYLGGLSTSPYTVGLSSSGDWIMCASIGNGRDKTTYVNLWGGPRNQETAAIFSTTMRPRHVTINSSTQDRLHGAFGGKRDVSPYETHKWVLLKWSPDITVSPTAATSEDVEAELQQAIQGSRELLLEGKYTNKLHARNATPDRVTRCSCKAAAIFDCDIMCQSSWSETTSTQSGDRASTSPIVAVGLRDGTVHFMHVRWNNV